METMIFSYRVPGLHLEPFNDALKLSAGFNRKALLDEVKEIFRSQNFMIDESSLSYKIKDSQVYLEGLAVEIEQPRSIGFMSGK